MKLTGIDELSRKFDIEAESKVAFEMAKGNGKNTKKWFYSQVILVFRGMTSWWYGLM